MNGLAMVMAGGAGTRMARAGGRVPKPLIPVAGATLLERNIRQLARHGFDTVIVVISAAASEIGVHVRRDLVAAAAAAGCHVEIAVEDKPLGNFGAVRMLNDRMNDGRDAALVVYADNVTALDLNAIRDFHKGSGAAMTIATHRQSFTMPFGEVTLDGSRVLSYREKPQVDFSVCSAISVVDKRVIDAILDGEPMGLSQTVQRLIARGLPVSAFAHEAPWVDVNDLDAVARAEDMVRTWPELFERWSADDLPLSGTVLLEDGGPFAPAVLDIFDASKRCLARWRVEPGKPETGRTPDWVIARARAFAGADPVRGGSLAALGV
jgi:NDP-sugar pyrophosphorylase family protein